MNDEIAWSRHLTASDIEAVDALLGRVSATDGLSAMSEHTYLYLLAGGGHGDRHALVRDDDRVVGYAQITDDDPPLAELLIDPDDRGRGLGAALLASVMSEAGPKVTIWAHGDLPAARALARRAGLVPLRRLCRYSRPLTAVPDVALPGGMTLRAFTPDDAEQWLALNAEAFADLPDQGSWSMADLKRRLDQPWFDPQGFLVAVDDRGLAGFHWTKQHVEEGAEEPVGEVYVLAVADRARGTGLASALTLAGLEHLRDTGCSSVMLFVDSDNEAAVRLYTRLGFTRGVCDVLYGSEQDATDSP